MIMGTVYCTQIPHRHDSKTGALVPSLNITPASEFGEVIVMMPPRSAFYDMNYLFKEVFGHLSHFKMDNDFLLPLGDPVLCGLCAAFLGRRLPYFDILKWDKNIGRYTRNRVRGW